MIDAWKTSFVNERRACRHCTYIVNRENADSSTANRRFSNQLRSIPAKMCAPFMPTWVKQAEYLFRQRIEASYVRTLAGIASRARQARIRSFRFAAMLQGNDMVNRKAQFIRHLRQLAVFAAVVHTFANPSIERELHRVSRCATKAVKRPTGFRLKDRQKIGDLQVLVQQVALVGSERTFFCFSRQFGHSCMVFLVEIESEKRLCGIG